MRRLAAPLLLLLISICFCWRIVLTDQYTWLDSTDLAYQVLPWLQMEAGEWRHARVPLWDPYLWAGQPLLGQVQPSVASPLNLLFLAVPLRNGWIRQSAFHWYFLFLRFLPALFMYLLCRDLRLPRFAGIVSGCIFAFGSWIAYTDWPQHVTGGIWLPLIAIFLLRSIRTERRYRNASLCGLFLGLAWLSGHHQAPLLITITVALIWAYESFRTGRVEWKTAASAALAFTVLFLVSAVQTLPAMEYGRLAKRWSGAPEPLSWDQKVPYPVHAEYSLQPATWPGLVIPFVNGNAQPFTGALAVSLALLGIWAYRDRHTVQVAAAIALIGGIIALGGSTFVHGVLYAVVPLVEKARVPATALSIFHFGLSLLCAYGATAYISGDHVSRVRWTGRALLSLGALTFLFCTALYIVRIPIGHNRVIVSSLLWVIGGAVMATAWRSSLVLPSLICFELSLMFLAQLPNRTIPEQNRYLKPMAQFADVVEYLRTRGEPIRIDVDGEIVPFNFGDWYGVEQLGGYLASVTTNVVSSDFWSRRTQDLLGVNYFVGKAPQDAAQQDVFTSQTGLKLYRNPSALPRVRVVHSVTQVQKRNDVNAFIADQRNDLARSAVMLSPPPDLEVCSGFDEATLLRHTPSEVIVQVTTPCRGMMVLADTYFPGWRATLDGNPAPIHEVYGMVRGVAVDRGTHTIVMRYRPTSVLIGSIMTLAGLVLVLVVHRIPRPA